MNLHYTGQGIYRSYLLAQVSSRSSSSTNASVTFNSFSFKGTSPDNDCSRWGLFATNSLVLPVSGLYYFSSVTVLTGHEDLSTGFISNGTAVCGDWSAVAAITHSLTAGTASSIICGGRKWSLNQCGSRGSVCIDCPPSRSCPLCSFTSPMVSVPCSDRCASHTASFAVMSFTVSAKIFYPQFLGPIRYNTTKDVIELQLNLTAAGTSHCAAFPRGSQVASTAQIYSGGHTVQSISPGSPVAVRISGLSPSTSYDVYCYTEDFKGHSMDLQTSTAHKVTVVTACCKQIIMGLVHDRIYDSSSSQSKSPVYAFAFSLNAYPAAAITVAATVSATNCSGDAGRMKASAAPVAHSLPSVSPNQFSFSPTSSTLTSSFLILGKAGCYSLLMSDSSSPSTFAPSVTYFEIITASTPPIPPTLTAASFSGDGRFLTATFDSATDQAQSIVPGYAGLFACAFVVSFKGATAATMCRWLTMDQYK